MMEHARFKKQQRGVAAVEFGILIVPLLLMLLGLSEYGRAIYQYNTLAKSVRDATRLLTTVAPGNRWSEARCLAVYGNMGCTGNVLVPGLTTAMVSICDSTNCAGTHALVSTGQGAVNLVTVEIRGFQFQSLFNFTIGSLTIGAPDINYDTIGNTMRQAL
jgi:Flp pilus assembly protein TadG